MKPRISIVAGSVRKVCQLTGECDRERKVPTLNRTQTRFQLFGTDLGSSFEHQGRLWFLFGDTWPWPAGKPVTDSDSVASTTATEPEREILLEFVSSGGVYRSPQLFENRTHLSTGAFEVPIAGFSVAGQMYVFHSTDRIDPDGGPSGLDLFWIGPDGAPASACANPRVLDGQWRSAFPIGPGGASRADAPICAVTRFDGALDVFWIGPDGAVASTWANPRVDNGAWHAPFPITPPRTSRINSPLAAITRLDGALDAFWIGPDSAVATTWANPHVDKGAWHAPFPITPPGASRTNSPLVAITRFDGALDVFWIGPDGAVATTWANPHVDKDAWHAPFPITPPGASRTNSPLAAITRLDGALDAFWIGPDSAVATTWANPHVDKGAWHTPFPITPPGASRTNSPLAVISRFDGALDVFWIGPDGALATTWANPNIDQGAWHLPFPITPPGASRVNSPLGAVTRLDGALDVFWIGPDGALATTWANPNIDQGAWHLPFPITEPQAAHAESHIAALTRSSGSGVLMGRTVLAIAHNNDPTDLHSLYDFSVLRRGGKFINVACSIVKQGLSGLPFKGPALIAWGSGRYRESNVYLACVPLAQVRDDLFAWRYFAGNGSSTSRPVWITRQESSVPLFIDPQVGELSVSFIKPLGLWLMLYNSASPRGITARVANFPWGPWADRTILFDPSMPGLGYGHFMHVKDSGDGLSDIGRESEWGGEYGPYLIDRFTEVESNPSGWMRAQIYFVLSTWNPYNTVLMTATIQRDSDD